MKSFPILFFVICGLFISVTPAFAQSVEVTVDTSKDSYEEGEVITVSGNVTPVIAGQVITLQIFYQGTLIHISQFEVGQDGSYTETILAEGKFWTSDGDYIIKATYGEGNSIEKTIKFFSEKGVPETTNIFEVDAGSSGTFDVEYTIRGGVVKDMLVDSDIFALIVIIQSDDDGTLTVELPRDSIDAKKSSGADDTYIILIDGVEVPYQEVSTSSKSRTITIEFEGGDSDIEIIGTFVIPEFGTIAVMILVVAIMSAIILSRKNQLIRI